jgi:hypothetical protein
LFCAFVIALLDPPESIDINYPLANMQVIEGTRVKINCMSRGGNPLPDIEWSLTNSKAKLTPLLTQSIIYTTESTLELVLHREHHNQQLQCMASNKVGFIKKVITFNVSCKLFNRFFFLLLHNFTVFFCHTFNSKSLSL